MNKVDNWFYPKELENEFRSSGLPAEQIPELLATAWEYDRCTVPEFTNWERYMALARLCAIGTMAEYNAAYVDLFSGDRVLGYDIDEQLDILFGGSVVRDDMGSEYKSSLLFMTQKSGGRRGSKLFHRYADALAYSLEDYCRIRDCDGMFRFFVFAAIACNDSNEWLTEAEMRILAEIAVTSYDSVAFYKHRAEGEISNTFAYANPELRAPNFRRCREILWSLDVNWASNIAKRCAIHFCRAVAGPIHVIMRRYRYLEDGMTLGKPETEEMVQQARRNVKLWYRNDSDLPVTDEYYDTVMAQQKNLLFPGFADMLNRRDEDKCPNCIRKDFYGANKINEFSGVRLCSSCQTKWNDYMETIVERAREILPLSEAH
jgi:hypothetical protein